MGEQRSRFARQGCIGSILCVLAGAWTGCGGERDTTTARGGGAAAAGTGGTSGGGAGATGGAGIGGAAGTTTGGTSGFAGSAGTAGTAGTASVPPLDPLEGQRAACAFSAGALPKDTLGNLPDAFPIKHIVITMLENRSFDHYFGRMPAAGHTDVDGFPSDYANTAIGGAKVPPAHATTSCITPDAPHDWASSHTAWANGKMDGFYAVAAATGDPHRVMLYYEEADLPFYYFLNRTFAMSDQNFASVLGPTAPNRMYFYAGSSYGAKAAEDGATPASAPSIFKRMLAASVPFSIFGNASWEWAANVDASASYVVPAATFFDRAAAGTLPAVSFVDPFPGVTEHPPEDVTGGEAWVRKVVSALVAGPDWTSTVFVLTYDEGGGFFDHAPPPAACTPDADAKNAEFDRYGVRVPLVVVSPWSRPGYVSHRTHSAASVTRLIEAVHGLPAMTARDANSDALLDMFDFSKPALMTPPAFPEAGASTCK